MGNTLDETRAEGPDYLGLEDIPEAKTKLLQDGEQILYSCKPKEKGTIKLELPLEDQTKNVKPSFNVVKSKM